MVDEKILDEFREYLKDNFIPSHINGLAVGMSGLAKMISPIPIGRKVRSLRNISDDASDYIKEHREPGGFAHALDRIRQEKGLTPAELYKKANIDRRLYSRFMGPEKRHPSKNTVISFALALELNRNEFDNLLQTAGYALSRSSNRDVCIMFCLEKGCYNIDDVNTLLFTIGAGPLSRDTLD